MPQGVGVQVPPSAQEDGTLPRRLMVGQQPLELFIVVRIHAGQQIQCVGMFRGCARREPARGQRVKCGIFEFRSNCFIQ